MAAYGVPVHLALKALRFMRAATRLAAMGGIERGGLSGGRSAKPRGGAPEWRVELRPTRHRATSHNGARYASVRSKTPSHVALSGAPPRCLQAEKSGSGCRHTFRPSGNPSGWNRKRSVPLVLLSVNSGVMGCASVAAKRYAARKSGLPLVGLSRGTPRSPVPLCRPLQASGVRSEDGPAILSFKRSSFTPSPE